MQCSVLEVMVDPYLTLFTLFRPRSRSLSTSPSGHVRLPDGQGCFQAKKKKVLFARPCNGAAHRVRRGRGACGGSTHLKSRGVAPPRRPAGRARCAVGAWSVRQQFVGSLWPRKCPTRPKCARVVIATPFRPLPPNRSRGGGSQRLAPRPGPSARPWAAPGRSRRPHPNSKISEAARGQLYERNFS